MPAVFPSVACCERVEGRVIYRQVREAGRLSENLRHMGPEQLWYKVVESIKGYLARPAACLLAYVDYFA